MKNDNMDSGRLEAFVDAIIAIVITIIVLGFPQPENTSFEAIWNLKPVFFAYLTSFITCFTMWYSHHNMFHYIKRIDRKVIVSTGIMLFWITLLPFLTILSTILWYTFSFLPVLSFCNYARERVTD